jgi:hypothetical protein
MNAHMKIIAVALLAAAPLSAHAEDLNFARLDTGTNVVTLTTGAEHGLVLGAGYAHVMQLAGRPLVVGGDLTLVGGDADLRDFRLRAGALASVVGDGAWKVIGGASAVVRATKNDLAQMVDVGSDISILGGRYSKRWFVAAELGFDWAITTHITHSDAYRMIVYPDARDGWYGNAGGLFRGGIQGGASFGANDIIVRAGMLRDDSGKSPMFPIYATAAYDRRF